MWHCTPVIPKWGRWRRQENHEFEVNVGYTVRSQKGTKIDKSKFKEAVKFNCGWRVKVGSTRNEWVVVFSWGGGVTISAIPMVCWKKDCGHQDKNSIWEKLARFWLGYKQHSQRGCFYKFSPITCPGCRPDNSVMTTCLSHPEQHHIYHSAYNSVKHTANTQYFP